MIRSDDYHDYFLQEGRFVGAFEEMYRNCADPWHQDASPPLDENLGLLLLGMHSYSRVLDLGCGKGRFTGRLHQATRATVTALDIAPTAIRAARERRPEIRFLVGSAGSLPLRDAAFDLVVSSQLLWCTIPELAQVFAEVRRVLVPGGHFLIVQTYYPAGRQRYATEVMTGPDDLLRLLPFRPLHTVELNRGWDPRFVTLAERLP